MTVYQSGLTPACAYQPLEKDHPALVQWHRIKDTPEWRNFFGHATQGKYDPTVIDDVHRACHAAFVHAFLLGMRAAEDA